jgi:hypothetical protein
MLMWSRHHDYGPPDLNCCRSLVANNAQTQDTAVHSTLAQEMVQISSCNINQSRRLFAYGRIVTNPITDLTSRGMDSITGCHNHLRCGVQSCVCYAVHLEKLHSLRRT